jgi:hypothetical protein
MSAFVERADRLRLPIPIRYRQQGDDEWFVSHVENISETGVLFGPTGLASGAAVEVILSAPVAVGARIAGPHVCNGRIVRTTEMGAAAVRLESCRGVLD